MEGVLREGGGGSVERVMEGLLREGDGVSVEGGWWREC